MKTCRSLYAAASAALLLGLGAPAHATSFDKLIVFGDSLSDGGNAFNMVDSPIFPNGFPPPPNNERNSNELVAVEYLAQRLGVPLLPSTEGGTNYAVSGAMTQVRDGFFPPGNPISRATCVLRQRSAQRPPSQAPPWPPRCCCRASRPPRTSRPTTPRRARPSRSPARPAS